ncbi:MAG: YafY family transcriptional regulator [Actinomycetota bacterium]|nr:YafY family transcriptional regulator [Actinomycetota bacterium]
MSRPTSRVLALLELLQAGGVRRVGELADRLGVDERTVRRYAEHLSELGVPIQAQRGRYGGYRLLPGYKLPPLMLTDDEAVAVALGLVAGRRVGLAPADAGAAETALAKVRRVLPAALAARLGSLLSVADFAAAQRPAVPPETEVLLTLAAAARERRTVQLRYTSFAGRESDRDVDPYGLVFHSGRWYVSGHDHDRGEVRTFRLDRVRSARATPRSFEPPAEFDAGAHVLAGLAAVPYAHEVSVVLHADVSEVRRRLPPAFGTLTEVPGGVRLVARAERLDGMAQLLAGLGWRFCVERPEELRVEVRALAGRLAADAG